MRLLTTEEGAAQLQGPETGLLNPFQICLKENKEDSGRTCLERG